MSQTRVYKINSSDKMAELGEKLAASLGGGDVLLLTGELGAGKTVLSKGLAKGFGITAPVTSPTFTIMNEYCDGRVKFCHFDAYRLDSADEAVGAGLTDFIGNAECVCAVEWWRNIEELFDGLNTVEITINKTGDNEREVIIKQ